MINEGSILKEKSVKGVKRKIILKLLSQNINGKVYVCVADNYIDSFGLILNSESSFDVT